MAFPPLANANVAINSLFGGIFLSVCSRMRGKNGSSEAAMSVGRYYCEATDN